MVMEVSFGFVLISFAFLLQHNFEHHCGWCVISMEVRVHDGVQVSERCGLLWGLRRGLP